MVDTEQSLNRTIELLIRTGLPGLTRERTILVPEIIDRMGAQLDSDPRIALWDQWASRYHTLLNLRITKDLWEGFGEVITNHVPKTDQRMDCLDLGCGTGFVVEKLARNFPYARIVGADRSIPFLRKTQERIGTRLQGAVGRVVLNRMDLTRPFPWGDGSYDLATMNFVLQYFSALEQQHIVAESARILRKGGLLVISTFTQGTAFGDVIKPIIVPEVLKGGIKAVMTFANIPVTRKFDSLRREGKMHNPSIEDLEGVHLKAGFKEFKIARKMVHPQGWDYGVYTVAIK